VACQARVSAFPSARQATETNGSVDEHAGTDPDAQAIRSTTLPTALRSSIERNASA